ncbi:hypothetical protein Q8A73_021824 [Channa argus]|nr:hypothetical protein Q8A73_021824 [Channa argus]
MFSSKVPEFRNRRLLNHLGTGQRALSGKRDKLTRWALGPGSPSSTGLRQRIAAEAPRRTYVRDSAPLSGDAHSSKRSDWSNGLRACPSVVTFLQRVLSALKD